MCSAYVRYHYWDLNFNSLANIVVLFYLMIVNNWVIIMEGYVAVTSVWARCYFVAWFLVIVFVVLNVVTAFLLDFFTKQEEENKLHDAGYIPEWHDRIIKAALQLEQVKIKLPFANEREPPANELFKGFTQRVKDWIIVRPSHTMDKSKCFSIPGPGLFRTCLCLDLLCTISSLCACSCVLSLSLCTFPFYFCLMSI